MLRGNGLYTSLVAAISLTYIMISEEAHSAASEGEEVQLARKRARVAVIGGGICGMFTALELSALGHEVHVYERDKIGVCVLCMYTWEG
jgi:NADPH-dependent glutamate synthase beta subunit-like oxidoreductase